MCMNPAAFESKVTDKFDPATKFWQGRGYAGDAGNLQHQLAAKVGGTETATDVRAREMAGESGLALRDAAYNRQIASSQSGHVQSIAAMRARREG